MEFKNLNLKNVYIDGYTVTFELIHEKEEIFGFSSEYGRVIVKMVHNHVLCMSGNSPFENMFYHDDVKLIESFFRMHIKDDIFLTEIIKEQNDFIEEEE